MDITAYQHMNIRMSTRGKRPLRNLTPPDKVRAIQRIHNGETKASVSRDIGVPESTLRGWCKNEQKLRFMCRQLGAADNISPMPGIENPPEKRTRFDKHHHTQKYPSASNFNEYGYNRLPLDNASFPLNCSNAILEKMALNEILRKHLSSDITAKKQSINNISAQMPGVTESPIAMAGGYISQLSIMQNLNLLSILFPNTPETSNVDANGIVLRDSINNKAPLCIANESNLLKIEPNYNDVSSSKPTSNCPLAVKNFLKDARNHNVVNLTDQKSNSNSAFSTEENNIKIGINCSNNDSNNNTVKERNSIFTLEATFNNLNLPSPAPPALLQIRNNNDASDTENDNNTPLLEWCKVFNASLNFLTLAAAAAALQPDGALPAASSTMKRNNNLHSASNSPSFNCSEVSNDSFFGGEPEDLSVRSTTTLSPAISRPESLVQSKRSCSPSQDHEKFHQ